MAKDEEKKPTAAEKGKGKAVSGDAQKQEVQNEKDGKPMDDKKGAPPAGTYLMTSSEMHQHGVLDVC